MSIEIKGVDDTLIKTTAEEVKQVVQKTNITVIQTQDEYNNCADFLQKVKKKYREIENKRKMITRPLDEAKKQVMDLFRPLLETLQKAEQSLKKVMLMYAEEQKRLAEEKQRKLEEEARKKAEIERRRKEELERKWREREKLLREQGKEIEAERAAQKAEEKALEKELVQEEIVPIVTPSLEKVKGIAYKEIWSAEITDVNQIPREYMVPNLQALNKIAQATKGAISIPGVRFVCRKIIASVASGSK